MVCSINRMSPCSFGAESINHGLPGGANAAWAAVSYAARAVLSRMDGLGGGGGVKFRVGAGASDDGHSHERSHDDKRSHRKHDDDDSSTDSSSSQDSGHFDYDTLLQGNWSVNFCSCLEDVPICFFGWWCPCILAGMNAEKLGQAPLLYCMGTATGCCPMVAALRVKTREKFKIKVKQRHKLRTSFHIYSFSLSRMTCPTTPSCPAPAACPAPTAR